MAGSNKPVSSSELLRSTFMITIAGTALFVGAVFLFVL